LAKFVRPAEAGFFWRAKPADSMMKPNAFEALGSIDSAICGPVRARSAQKTRITRRLVAVVAAMFLFVDSAAAVPQHSRPSAEQVAAAIERWFAQQDNYQPGDLITRSQVRDVLSKLADAGAKVPAASKIAELALDDNSTLVRKLSTNAGRKFMRRIAQDPGGFANLDRLSRTSGGEKVVQELIDYKDGDKLIEYMATRNGRNMMANVPGASDPNRPTGRIYTVDDLIDVVTTAWQSQ